MVYITSTLIKPFKETCELTVGGKNICRIADCQRSSKPVFLISYPILHNNNQKRKVPGKASSTMDRCIGIKN